MIDDPTDRPDWYKDAVIYELHVRAFSDSNEDGVGDFPRCIGNRESQQTAHCVRVGKHVVRGVFALSALVSDGAECEHGVGAVARKDI